jgi:formylglycine-generating enzyme required for sulfatase activity
VIFAGQFLGTTPLEMNEWEEGQRVQLRKAGYLPIRVALSMEDGENGMTVNLRAETAAIRLSGELEGTVIRVEGETVLLEPDGVLALPLKENRIQIQKEGFELWERLVTPAKSYQREVVVDLVPVAAKSEASPVEKSEPEDSPVTVNSVGMEMVRVEVPIQVDIGAERGTPGRKSHEGIRKIRLEKPFRLSATEITNAQFARFDPSHSSGTSGSLNLSAANLPVVSVTWEQAVAFCNWLSEQENLPPAYLEQDGRWAFSPHPGTGYRLPTEAEWEGVLRHSLGNGLYTWGDSLPPPSNTVNMAGEESKSLVRTTLSKYRDDHRGPVAASEAYEQPEGFRGMMGNVREWVHDGFSAPQPGQKTQVDPMEDSAAQFHVIKGASWMDGLWIDLRLARRRYDEAGAPDLGFRVARYLSE